MKVICAATLLFIVALGMGTGLHNALHSSGFTNISSDRTVSSERTAIASQRSDVLFDYESSGTIRLQVDAGAYDRLGTIISFPLPVAADPGVYPLYDEQQEIIALQVDDKNRGWFRLNELPANTSAHFTLDLRSMDEIDASITRTNSGVYEQMDAAAVIYSTEDRKVLSYFYGYNDPPDVLDESYRRGGNIHPVYSPSGVILSSHLTLVQHSHQSGTWSAWTHTRFEDRNPDFWNVQNELGRVDVDSLIHSWEGIVFGGFRSTHRHTDLTSGGPVMALNETWQVHVYASSPHEDVHIFDLELTQTANTSRPLYLPEYHYGGFAFRGHIDWFNLKKVLS